MELNIDDVDAVCDCVSLSMFLFVISFRFLSLSLCLANLLHAHSFLSLSLTGNECDECAETCQSCKLGSVTHGMYHCFIDSYEYLWICLISLVRPTGQPSCGYYTQTFHPNLFIPAVLIGIIDCYHFILFH